MVGTAVSVQSRYYRKLEAQSPSNGILFYNIIGFNARSEAKKRRFGA
jgi:hypothetical protein